MKKFGIMTNIPKDKDMHFTRLIREWLLKNNCEVFISEDIGKALNEEWHFSKIEEIMDNIDCAIILGGDGTILNGARALAIKDIPIVGVNLGTLGFLAEIEKENVIDVLGKILEDNYIIENRMMLDIEVIREGKSIVKAVALNDAVITRNDSASIVKLKSYINNELSFVYEADGVIVSTPTGSTAYNLSAGGPILHYSSKLMVVTPICSHSLISRSIVVSGHDIVTIEVDSFRKKDSVSNVLFIDGQDKHCLEVGDKVRISKSNDITKLLIVTRNNFYDILTTKIGIAKEN